MSSAGYSGTPLVKKLGIGDDCRLWVAGAPADYERLLAPMPPGITFARRPDATVQIAHIFVTRREKLAGQLRLLRMALGPNAAIWVSWPKQTSGVATTVTEQTIRDVALPLGLVDVKVCAVTDVWSGLKLVVRKAER